jgi:hypothetical protein
MVTCFAWAVVTQRNVVARVCHCGGSTISLVAVAQRWPYASTLLYIYIYIVTCLVCHVTTNFTMSGCSDYLLRSTYTLYKYNLWSQLAISLNKSAARSQHSSASIFRMNLQMQYLLISLQPLLINEPFVTTVSEETRLLSQAIPTQRVTVDYNIAYCYFLCSGLF